MIDLAIIAGKGPEAGRLRDCIKSLKITRDTGIVFPENDTCLKDLVSHRHSSVFDRYRSEPELWLRHRTVVLKALDLGANSVMIIDQDAILPNDKGPLVEACENLPIRFGLAKLDHRRISAEGQETVSSDLGHHWRAMISMSRGAGGYIIDRRAMHVMLQDMTPCVPFDDPGRTMVPVDELFVPWRFTSRLVTELFIPDKPLVIRIPR